MRQAVDACKKAPRDPGRELACSGFGSARAVIFDPREKRTRFAEFKKSAPSDFAG
jgi:hypothetical protein